MAQNPTLKRVLCNLRAAYPGLVIYATENYSCVWLNAILVPQSKRGQGIGTKAVQTIMYYSRNNKKMMKLRPTADLHMEARLEKFYLNLGFIWNSEDLEQMMWHYTYGEPKI